jgi:hypothetical protein
MAAARSRPDPPAPLRYRWVAPALLLAIVVGLAPLWWEVTAPPELSTVQARKDPGGALLVPAAALRPSAPLARLEEAGEAVLFVVRDGVARLTRVRLGAMRDDAVEVREGLDEAALVLANPPRGLEDRHRVRAGKQ